MELSPSAAITASVGLRHLMDHWGFWPASPTPLTRFIGLAPLRQMHARPTHRTPPLRSAKACGSWKSGVASLNQIKGMGWFGQGQNNPLLFALAGMARKLPKKTRETNRERASNTRTGTRLGAYFSCSIPSFAYVSQNLLISDKVTLTHFGSFITITFFIRPLCPRLPYFRIYHIAASYIFPTLL
jgi:hypothetical protein